MDTEATAQRPPLSNITKAAYAFGSVAFGLKAVALGAVMLFYNQVMGLSAIWVSSGIGAALIIDAVIDPMIGQISDMWRSRWGRRHPFMYLSALPTALAVFALLNPPHGIGDRNLFIYMMVCIVSARVFIAMFEIPSTSLLPEIAPNYDDRTTILSYRYFVGVFAPLIMGVIALNVFLKPFVNAAGVKEPGQLNPAGYGIYGLTLASVIFVSILASALGTHSEVKYMRPPIKHASLGAMLTAMAATLTDRNFLALTISGVVNAIGAGLVGGLTSYLYTYYWALSAQQISILTGVVVFAPFTALALGPYLAKKMGKKHAALATFYASIFVGAAPMILRLAGILPPDPDALVMSLLAIDAVIAATLGIVGFIVCSSMMADIVEQVQTKTGKRAEGLLFSADGLLKQIVTGVGAMGTGYILAYVHFPDKAIPGHVPPEVLTHLALIYLPINASAALLSTSVIWFYSINRAQHDTNLALVAETL